MSGSSAKFTVKRWRFCSSCDKSIASWSICENSETITVVAAARSRVLVLEIGRDRFHELEIREHVVLHAIVEHLHRHRVPSGNVARCTCATDPDAIGSGSNEPKRSDTACAQLAFRPALRDTGRIRRDRRLQLPSSSATSSPTTSGRRLSTWPNLTHVVPNSVNARRNRSPSDIETICGSTWRSTSPCMTRG